MRALTLLLLVVTFLPSCVRAVHATRREQPVDTGHTISFSSERPLRWDFGDGAVAQGQIVEHSFAKAGSVEVKGFDGEHLVERVSVFVQPRPALRAVSPRAEAAVVFRSVDDVAPALDFFERLGAPASVQELIERAPVLQFLLTPGTQGGAALDRLEGAGAWLPADEEALVSFFGVQDDALAAKAFGEFLVDRGWRPAGTAGEFEAHGLRGALLIDRGTAYFVTAKTPEALAGAVAQVKAMPATGLESDAALAVELSDLASGGVVVLVRSEASGRAGSTVSKGAWSMALGALKFGPDDARLIGRVVAGAPLWKTPPASRPQRLLAHAPDGPVGVLAMDVPVLEVLDAFGLAPKRTDDGEARAGLSLLSRRLDVTLTVDVEEFLRATILGGGKPAVRFTALAETPVVERLPVLNAIERFFSRRRLPFDAATEKNVSVWRTTAEAMPLELALDADTLYARWGRALSGRAPVDLVQRLSRRVDGACGPGHVTLFLDVGQLNRELLDPRQVPGVDPRKVIATQVLTSTFVSQLTTVDSVLLDLAPSERGATISLEVTLSRRDGPRDASR